MRGRLIGFSEGRFWGEMRNIRRGDLEGGGGTQ